MLSVHFLRSGGTFETSSRGLALLTLLSTMTGTQELPEKQNTLPFLPVADAVLLLQINHSIHLVSCCPLASVGICGLITEATFSTKENLSLSTLLALLGLYQQHKLQLLPSLGNMLFVVTEKPKPTRICYSGKLAGNKAGPMLRDEDNTNNKRS